MLPTSRTPTRSPFSSTATTASRPHLKSSSSGDNCILLNISCAWRIVVSEESEIIVLLDIREPGISSKHLFNSCLPIPRIALGEATWSCTLTQPVVESRPARSRSNPKMGSAVSSAGISYQLMAMSLIVRGCRAATPIAPPG